MQNRFICVQGSILPTLLEYFFRQSINAVF